MSQTQLVFGDVKIAYVKDNLRETLDTFQKEADVPIIKKLADYFKIKAVPFDKKALLPVLVGEVQNEWYRVVKGQVVGQPVANQKARLERYNAHLEMVEKSDGTDLLAHKTSKQPKGSGERKATVYRLRKETEETWSKFKGQKRLIIRAMKDLDAFPGGKGCTVKQIADTVRDTEETTAPNDKNCAFHMNAFGHEAIVEKLDDNGEWQLAHKDAAPAEPPKKKEEKKPEPTKDNDKGKKEEPKGGKKK